MAATFDRFSDLPGELRDQIWSFAIRTARPGVHIFRLYNSHKDDHAGAHDVVSLACCFDGHHLAAPSWDRYFDNIDTTCSDRNLSTYLIDGGLWTACKESRLMMEKHFQSSEWNYRRKHQQKDLERKGCRQLLQMPATGYFSCDGDTPHYFTVLPHQDLFVLQPESLDNIDWDRINFDIPIGSTVRGFEGIRHLAIEYNPEWGIQMSKAEPHQADLPIVQTLIQAAFNVDHAWKIWFIDHNLKRKKDAAVFEEIASCYDTNAFYASDRKFLEVKCDYGATSLDHWRYIQQVGDGSCYECSIYFVKSLIQAIKDSMDLDDTGADDDPCLVGLLGWDNL
ncbi:hypothetical protein B0T10DRAFT_458102 [Thelonectria olida]|uniref:2EXR domain-containing protein n=1 Tax=Thelonectria olida TaxID=1576542 RepID=A0A9P8W8P5_9HYPO|nr:hypothetical protein B0T10DRAFT_458102 [Thelonectria olida]